MTYSYTKNADGHYICPQCNIVKKNQNTMHYHLKTHESRLPYECSFCKKGFLHASTLELHKRAQHSKENEKLMNCNVPGCEFKGTLTKALTAYHYHAMSCIQIRDTTTAERLKELQAI